MKETKKITNNFSTGNENQNITDSDDLNEFNSDTLNEAEEPQVEENEIKEFDPSGKKVDTRFRKAEKSSIQSSLVKQFMKLGKDIRESAGKLRESDESEEGPEKKKKREIFQPVLINIQEALMLSSGILMGIIFLLFISFKEYWYDHFYGFNFALLLALGITAALGMLVLYFAKRHNPRLRGSIYKKVMFSRIGLILIVSGGSVFTYWMGEGGVIPLILGIIASLGIYFFIVSSRSISKWEAQRFFIFYLGALILVLVPVHETMEVGDTDYETLPLSPLNEVMVVAGASLAVAGIYLLRERSGYFGVWLFGIMILFLIPLHEIFNYVANRVYEPYDQSVAMVGSLFLFAGYLMFLYRYRQYIKMAEHLDQGTAYFEEGNLEYAGKEYVKAYWLLERLGSLMDFEVIWGYLANVYTGKQKFDKALTYYNIALDINESNDLVWNDKGNLHYVMRDYRKAIHSYREGISWNNENPVLYQNLAVALSATGLHERAIRNYNKAIKLDPDYEKAWHNKGRSLHDLGDYEDAIKSYDNAIRLNPSSEAWMDRGDVLYLMDKYREAFKSYDRMIKKYPDLPDVWIHKGVALYSSQMYDEAIEHFQKALEINSSLAVPYNMLGNTYAQLGKFDEAKESYEKAISNNPRFSRAYFNLARTLANEKSDALEAYQVAVRNTRARRLNKVWFDEAAQYYNSIIERNRKNAKAWRARGDLFFKIGRVNQAISSYAKAVEYDPNNAVMYNILGISLRRVKRLEDALKSFQEAIKNDENYAEAWNNKGNVLYLMGKLREALVSYNTALELRPRYRSAILNRRICINQLKSNIQLESVPIESKIERYNDIIETYRNQGYRVEMLERLLEEGKPGTIKSGFRDYRERVGKLKEIEKNLDKMNLNEDRSERLRSMLKNPARIQAVMGIVSKSRAAQQST